jgi:hypothetical protein
VTALPEAYRYDQRPVDETPIHTEELPPTPQRDRTIVATAWVEAPQEVIHLGDDFGYTQVDYKRRIGDWVLWRAGPAQKADARYMAVALDDPKRQYTFRLYADGTGTGTGPSGASHQRFRAWKEDLRDNQP